MCLPQQRKKYLKRGNINNSGTLDYLILRLEGKHKSSDGQRNLLPASLCILNGIFLTWKQKLGCLLVIQLSNTIHIHSLQLGQLDHRNHSPSSILMFCSYSLLTLLQFRKYASFFILAIKRFLGNNCNLGYTTETTEGNK